LYGKSIADFADSPINKRVADAAFAIAKKGRRLAEEPVSHLAEASVQSLFESQSTAAQDALDISFEMVSTPSEEPSQPPTFEPTEAPNGFPTSEYTLMTFDVTVLFKGLNLTLLLEEGMSGPSKYAFLDAVQKLTGISPNFIDASPPQGVPPPNPDSPPMVEVVLHVHIPYSGNPSNDQLQQNYMMYLNSFNDLGALNQYLKMSVQNYGSEAAKNAEIVDVSVNGLHFEHHEGNMGEQRFLSFSSTFEMKGVNIMSIMQNDQMALTKTTAKILRMQDMNVFYLSAMQKNDNGGNRRKLISSLSSVEVGVTALNDMEAEVTVSIFQQIGGNDDAANQRYNELAGRLTESVNIGNFTATLHAVAHQMGAHAFETVAVNAVFSSPPLIFDPSQSGPSMSPASFPEQGMVFLSAFFLSFFLSCLFKISWNLMLL
jgi:hypothetical protein